MPVRVVDATSSSDESVAAVTSRALAARVASLMGGVVFAGCTVTACAPAEHGHPAVKVTVRRDGHLVELGVLVVQPGGVVVHVWPSTSHPASSRVGAAVELFVSNLAAVVPG